MVNDHDAGGASCRSDWHRETRKACSTIETTLPVPQTDTGRWVENTKASGRTFVKELGKMAS